MNTEQREDQGFGDSKKERGIEREENQEKVGLVERWWREDKVVAELLTPRNRTTVIKDAGIRDWKAQEKGNRRLKLAASLWRFVYMLTISHAHTKKKKKKSYFARQIQSMCSRYTQGEGEADGRELLIHLYLLLVLLHHLLMRYRDCWGHCTTTVFC